MTWQIITAANLVIAGAYFSISYIIASGLIRTGQVSTNRLGLATALIFFTCGVHHGSHAVHMLLPSFGIDDAQAYDLRNSWHWQSAVWDIATAMVGVYYLSLRGSYSSVLRGAQMFEDLKVRERQALEINDSIVQGLTVAKYQLDRGADSKSREAIEDTLRKARGLISELLDEPGGQHKPTQPGDLRLSSPASVSGDNPAGP
jgi:hypothetical protein